MKNKILRMLALTVCALMVLTMFGCSSSKQTSSEAGGDESGILFDFDEQTGSGISESGGQTSGGGTSSGGGTASGSNKGDGDTVSEPVDLGGDDPFANIPQKLKGTTVVFAHFGDEGASEYQKVFKAFTNKTGIKVKLVSYGDGAYVSTISKQIAARSSPDVIICNEIFPEALEIAQPIQNLIDLKDDFWDDTVTKVSTISGNTYFVNSLKGVWHNVDMVFYNKKIFSDYGITSPADYYKRGEWTYENLRKCLEEVTKTGLLGGFVDPKMMAASMGIPVAAYNPDTGKFSQNLNKVIPVYQFTAQIAKDKLWNPDHWFGIFNYGEIGLYMNSAYGCKYNGWFKDCDPSIISAVPMPSSYNGTACKQSESMRAYGIAKGAKNPEGAAYLLRYFLDYSYYEDAGANIFKNEDLKNAYFTSMDEVAKNGVNYYFNWAIHKYSSVTADELKSIGNSDPAQVASGLSAMVNQFDSAVSKLNAKIDALR